MKCAIYARVSTDKQKTDMQLTDLREYVRRAGWESVEYLETESSVKKRPVFERMMQEARMRKFEFDVVIVWKLDRIALVLELDKVNVRFLSITQKNIDSDQKDPMGRFLLHLFAALAELERGIIVERVKAGVVEAKRQGTHCGRPKKVFRRDEATELRKKGLSWRAIAKELGVNHMTVKRALAGL